MNLSNSSSFAVTAYVSTAMRMTPNSPPKPSPQPPIKSWMQQNFLKLNRNKSEILMVGPNSLTRFTFLNNDGSTVTPSTQVRNLGIILDPPCLLLLIHALVTSRLDYCTSANKLQYVQLCSPHAHLHSPRSHHPCPSRPPLAPG